MRVECVAIAVGIMEWERDEKVYTKRANCLRFDISTGERSQSAYLECSCVTPRCVDKLTETLQRAIDRA